MVVLTCPECLSTKVKKYEGKMTEKGYDWFTCKECNNNFSLSKAGYTVESDLFE